MQVERLEVHRRESYEEGVGTFKGTLRVKGAYGGIELILDSQLSEDVLKLCAESLTRATRELAQNMTAAVLEQAGVPKLGGPDV